MPLFEWISELFAFASCAYGYCFLFRPPLFLNLIFSKPSDASETWPRIYLSTGAHPVDPAAEHIDAVASPETESREQQQQQRTVGNMP